MENSESMYSLFYTINEKPTMLIITQNLHHGGGSRFPSLMTTLLEKDPDVLILTEWRNNKLEQLEGLKGTYSHYFIEGIKSIKNSVSILTKKKAIMKKTYQNNVITIEYNGFNISGVYFPQLNEKKIVFDYLIDNTKEQNSLIAGDFNTGKHFIDEQGKTFYCAKEFAYISEQKMIDARKTRHSDTKDYSRYSNAGNGFRIDHMLVTKDLDEKISECKYDHSFRGKGLSDHSMMYLRFKI